MKAAADRSLEGCSPAKYPVGCSFKGKVTNVTDYGAFGWSLAGVEGWSMVSENVPRSTKEQAPSKLVTTHGTEVDRRCWEVD